MLCSEPEWVNAKRRDFWEPLVEEVKSGAAVADVARRHRVQLEYVGLGSRRPSVMLHVAADTNVFLAAEPVDQRRGQGGLVALVHSLFGMAPLRWHVFVGRRVDRVKVLF